MDDKRTPTRTPLRAIAGGRRWYTFATWGVWKLQVCTENDGSMILVGPKGYWIDSSRWTKTDWDVQMNLDSWGHSIVLADFCHAIDFCAALSPRDQAVIIRAVELWQTAKGSR